VRKHNPLILFDSIAQSDVRLRQIKNFTSFYDDLNAHKLPQYSFITPNMTNDAHDTNVTFAGNFLNNFLPPLLDNQYFSKDTLVLVTFDEVSTYPKPNRVYSFLIGGAVPENLKGTTDDTFYTHYSVIASLSANWGLPSLGRWDCGANLFKIIADKVGYTNWDVELENVYFNHSYPGPISSKNNSPGWPAPATRARCSSGHGILPLVHKTWAGTTPTYDYSSPVPYDSKSGTNTGIKYSRTLVSQPSSWNHRSFLTVPQPNGQTQSHITE
jgi:acid phosphatase